MKRKNEKKKSNKKSSQKQQQQALSKLNKKWLSDLVMTATSLKAKQNEAKSCFFNRSRSTTFACN